MATRCTPSPSCRRTSLRPRTTSAASSASGWGRSPTAATSSSSARRPVSAHVVGSRPRPCRASTAILGTVAGDDTLHRGRIRGHRRRGPGRAPLATSPASRRTALQRSSSRHGKARRPRLQRRPRHLRRRQVDDREATASRSSPAPSTSARRADDFEAVRQRALAAGAVEAVVVDAKEEFADDFLVPALKANALYEGRYPLVSALSPAGDRQAPGRGGPRARRRRRRPRLHRQGQRPGPLRGVDPRPGARPRDARARPRVGHDPRGRHPLRLPQRHPHHGDEGEGVLHRRQPLGPRHRVRRDGGPVGGAAARRVVDDAADGDRAPRPRRQLRGRRARRPRRRAASISSTSSPRSAPSSARYGWGRIDMVENRRVGIKSRETYECPAQPGA